MVKWSNSRKPVGLMVHEFKFEGKLYAVVKRSNGKLDVLPINDDLIDCSCSCGADRTGLSAEAHDASCPANESSNKKKAK